jgi:hypothetical protein
MNSDLRDKKPNCTEILFWTNVYIALHAKKRNGKIIYLPLKQEGMDRGETE